MAKFKSHAISASLDFETATCMLSVTWKLDLSLSFIKTVQAILKSSYYNVY